ncbi:MAG TPA: SLC13 family permease [Phycisphaerales bacterium]|nr:SLC13 family permease [Phycisphaerales bacterium]HMP35984.1 SLC13 family permease [Phycisphaerales bacterium]
MQATPSTFVSRLRLIALPGGPLLALAIYLLLPEQFERVAAAADGGALRTTAEFTAAGRATLAMMAWMATWWLTEAIDISATALLPLALFPPLGIASFREAAAPYAGEIIFLFMGGFMIAAAMQRWNLDRRIALIGLRMTGTSPRGMVLGFMIATAFLSMWVSNTATAAMMLPIAISVIALVSGGGARQAEAGGGAAPGARRAPKFALALLLGIAYAASIGGIATLIGSPPNGIAARFIAENYVDPATGEPVEMTFARWLPIGLPFTIIFLPLTWVLLTFVLHRPEIDRIEGGDALVRNELARLGRLSRGEWITLAVFVATATLWIGRPFLTSSLGAWSIGGDPNASPPVPGIEPFRHLTDGGVAILAAIVLFALPASARPLRPTLDWQSAVQIPWGILILFGGGLSLAAAVGANGVADFIGAQAAHFAGIPPIVVVLATTTMIVFLTELTSNTATTATMVPLLAALAPGLGVDPYLLIIPATIAASAAFMMPVATPPNAMVFATGEVTIPQMCWTGLWLNLLAVILITLIGYFVVVPMLG